MKKTLVLFSLLIACAAMFAQSGPTFPYQAVVRNSQNQLIKDSTFAIGVEVYQATDLKYKETQSVTTNANGQFTMNIGGGTDTTGSLSDIADWSVAKFKITYHLSGGDIVSENAVSPVPYALQAANNTALTELLSTMNARMDSLGRLVDSLSNMPHGGAADGQPCPGAATVSDGTYTYHTVKIGSQCWTKENLKTESSMGTTRWPDNDENNVATYGLLYDRTALVQGESSATIRGICPVGWHVPNDDEWDELANYLLTMPDEIYQCGYDASNIANALSAPTGWSNRNDEGCYAGNRSTTRNRTGFSALPAGSYYNGYNLFGSCAYFWSATTNNASVRYRNLAYDNSTIRPFSLNSANCCFSVRCLKDAETGGGTTPSAPATMSCEDVMNCLGDTLDRLNARITSQGETITTQGETIIAQGETITAQGNTIDSLFHLVDSLSNLPHGGGDTPDTPTDTFNCGTSKVKDVQNNEYNTVKIGNQCWTKENLRTKVGGVSDGDYGYPTGVTGNDTVTYGRLYSWAAVMSGAEASSDVPSRIQGICPEGWHVPSDGEWGNLINYVKNKNEYVCGGEDNIANALSSETGWTNSVTSGCNAGDSNAKRNQTGFSAVPAGEYSGTKYINFGSNAYFWSTTKINDIVRYYILGSDSSIVSQGFEFSENMGLSVRCLRN